MIDIKRFKEIEKNDGFIADPVGESVLTDEQKEAFKKLVDIDEEQWKKILACPIDDVLQKIRNEKVTIYQQK